MFEALRKGGFLGGVALAALWGLREWVASVDERWMLALEHDLHDKLMQDVVDPVTNFWNQKVTTVSDGLNQAGAEFLTGYEAAKKLVPLILTAVAAFALLAYRHNAHNRQSGRSGGGSSNMSWPPNGGAGG